MACIWTGIGLHQLPFSSLFLYKYVIFQEFWGENFIRKEIQKILVLGWRVLALFLVLLCIFLYIWDIEEMMDERCPFVRQSLNVSGNVRRWDTQSVLQPFYPYWTYFILRLGFTKMTPILTLQKYFITLYKKCLELYKNDSAPAILTPTWHISF